MRGPAEALQATVRSGARIGSGLGTSEPASFYAGLWDHVLAHDVHDSDRAHLLLYLNRQLPFTRGLPDAPNTIPVQPLRHLADDRRVTVVVEDTTPPGVPPGTFDDPEGVTAEIGARVATHVADHLDLTRGRALQVGIGQTSVAGRLGPLARARVTTDAPRPVARATQIAPRPVRVPAGRWLACAPVPGC